MEMIQQQDTQMQEIQQKLDFIIREIEIQRRQREEFEDLKRDLTRVTKDVYLTALTEFQDMNGQLQTGAVLHLLKKVLRDIDKLTKTFDIMSSTLDFMNDASPIVREMIIDAMHRLNEMEQNGYFEHLRNLDAVLTGFSQTIEPQEVKAIGDKMIDIIKRVKDGELTEEKTPGWFTLLKEMNAPETRKTLFATIRLTKLISTPNKIEINKP